MNEIERILEGILFLADGPLKVEEISLGTGYSSSEIEAALKALQSHFGPRGIQLREIAGGWQFQTADDLFEALERFVNAGNLAKLTPAALETLAVIAYKQPVSRGQISAIRGVNVESVIRTLEIRELIEVKEIQDGNHLLGTTDLFLERFGLKSLQDLPPIVEFLPDIQSDSLNLD
jgi:segregation and condensation protein B